MIHYKEKQINNFLTSFITAERTKIANFLANNPKILAVNLAAEMIYAGLPVIYVSTTTGVAIDQLNKVQQIRH